jgi:GxxExxY protein
VNADCQDFEYKELTEKIIRIFYRVYNRLGDGFLEKAYENAMMVEFKKERIPDFGTEPEVQRKAFDNYRK